MVMQRPPRIALFRYFGLSPLEIEIIYNTLSSLFSVQEENVPPDSNYLSFVEIQFPVSYSDSFFLLLGADRWNKIKGLLKEMKRRRGSKGLKVSLVFCGVSADPNLKVVFSLKSGKGLSQYDNAIEKIEYLVDTLPIQIENSLVKTERVDCVYDESSLKWIPQATQNGEDAI